jgi:hypothetical protein
MTPIERRLISGCAGIPGTGPNGESCGTCRFFFRRYDGRRRKQVNVCSLRIGDVPPIHGNIPSCPRWEASVVRRAELADDAG